MSIRFAALFKTAFGDFIVENFFATQLNEDKTVLNGTDYKEPLTKENLAEIFKHIEEDENLKI